MKWYEIALSAVLIAGIYLILKMAGSLLDIDPCSVPTMGHQMMCINMKNQGK